MVSRAPSTQESTEKSRGHRVARRATSEGSERSERHRVARRMLSGPKGVECPGSRIDRTESCSLLGADFPGVLLHLRIFLFLAL